MCYEKLNFCSFSHLFLYFRKFIHMIFLQKVNIALWLSAFTFALSVLYGVYDWNQGNVPNTALSVLYACTNKFVWSSALAWVTIACMTGNGGKFYTSSLINDIRKYAFFVSIFKFVAFIYSCRTSL